MSNSTQQLKVCSFTFIFSLFIQLQEESAFKEMVSPLEQRRLKYMKRKSEHGDRSEEVQRGHFLHPCLCTKCLCCVFLCAAFFLVRLKRELGQKCRHLLFYYLSVRIRFCLICATF